MKSEEGERRTNPPKEGERREEEKTDEEDKWRHPYGSGTRKNSSVAANKRVKESFDQMNKLIRN